MQVSGRTRGGQHWPVVCVWEFTVQLRSLFCTHNQTAATTGTVTQRAIPQTSRTRHAPSVSKEVIGHGKSGMAAVIGARQRTQTSALCHYGVAHMAHNSSNTTRLSMSSDVESSRSCGCTNYFSHRMCCHRCSLLASVRNGPVVLAYARHRRGCGGTVVTPVEPLVDAPHKKLSRFHIFDEKNYKYFQVAELDRLSVSTTGPQDFLKEFGHPFYSRFHNQSI